MHFSPASLFFFCLFLTPSAPLSKVWVCNLWFSSLFCISLASSPFHFLSSNSCSNLRSTSLSFSSRRDRESPLPLQMAPSHSESTSSASGGGASSRKKRQPCSRGAGNSPCRMTCLVVANVAKVLGVTLFILWSLSIVVRELYVGTYCFQVSQ